MSTKKQKARRRLVDNDIDFVNSNPRRFRTYEDAERRQNAIVRGQQGYDEAPWEEHIVIIKDALKLKC